MSTEIKEDDPIWDKEPEWTTVTTHAVSTMYFYKNSKGETKVVQCYYKNNKRPFFRYKWLKIKVFFIKIIYKKYIITN